MPEDWYLAHNIDKSWKQESSLTKWIWLATRLLHLMLSQFFYSEIKGVNLEQIYHGREEYLQKIPVERRSSYRSRNGEANSVSRMEFFEKYPAWPWYICLITLNIHLYLDVCVYIRKEFHGHEAPSFSSESIFFYDNATGTGDVIKIWHKGQCQI
jgi:hypothetical protein